MRMEFTPVTTPSTLLEELIERTGLTWLQVIIVVELALVLILVGAAYLDRVLEDPFNADFWRIGLIWPTVIAYALLTAPFSRQVRDGAIRAFRPLVPLDDDEFYHLLAEASLFHRRREWLAVGIGAGSTLLLVRAIWHWASVGQFGWPLTLYGLFAAGLMCSLIGYAIYSSMAGTKLFTELSLYPLSVSVFDLASLEPIARWSLVGTLTYIGGITLSILFLPRLAWFSVEIIVVIYVPLTLTAVLVFFLNMTSVHGDIVEAKRRELNTVRDSLVKASQTLEERVAKGQIEETPALLNSIKAWTSHEEWIRSLPEWPYTTHIKRNLILSLLLPGLVGIGQEMFFSFIRRLLPSL